MRFKIACLRKDCKDNHIKEQRPVGITIRIAFVTYIHKLKDMPVCSLNEAHRSLKWLKSVSVVIVAI